MTKIGLSGQYKFAPLSSPPPLCFHAVFPARSIRFASSSLTTLFLPSNLKSQALHSIPSTKTLHLISNMRFSTVILSFELSLALAAPLAAPADNNQNNQDMGVSIQPQSIRVTHMTYLAIRRNPSIHHRDWRRRKPRRPIHAPAPHWSPADRSRPFRRPRPANWRTRCRRWSG